MQELLVLMATPFLRSRSIVSVSKYATGARARRRAPGAAVALLHTPSAAFFVR